VLGISVATLKRDRDFRQNLAGPHLTQRERLNFCSPSNASGVTSFRGVDSVHSRGTAYHGGISKHQRAVSTPNDSSIT
jgi:hypothetical protein